MALKVPSDLPTGSSAASNTALGLEFPTLWHTSLTDGASPHAEDVLRLQERAVAAAPSGVTIADARQPDCPVIYCNPAFTTITGYTAADVLGRNCRFYRGQTPTQMP